LKAAAEASFMTPGDLPSREEGCPGRDALAAYAAGQLPSAVLEAVAEHVAACPACLSTLEEAHSRTADGDPLVAQLRRCARSPAPTEQAGGPETAFPSTVQDAGPGAVSDAGATGAAAAPEAGGLFGQYELREEIGRGAMGVVYKARQTRLDRFVAIKMIHAGAYAGPAERLRFCVEGQAVARLQHPHVIQVHEFNEHGGQLYLCTEFLEGGTLAGKLGGARLPLRDAARLVQTLAEAVHAAHERHIVHRDLKPSNVLLTADGTPKVGDFGLAKLLDAGGGETAPDAILGTPSYMAPEQAAGRAHEVGPPADVYALGAILYEALAGRPPFRGATRLATLELVRSASPAPPTSLRRDVPADLEAVCLKCLEKEPGRRYASAAALGRDLGRWLRGEPTEARPLPWYARAWRRVPRRVAAAALLAAAAVAAVALYLRLTAPDPERPAREAEARLARHEAVTLIGDTGAPAWSRWRTGEETSQTSLAGDGTFTISSWNRAMLELVRDPQVDRYQIRADVRHEKGDDFGEVGLVVGLRAYPAGDAPLYFFVRVAFNDVKDVTKAFRDPPPGVEVPVPKANPVYLDTRLYAEGKPRPLWDTGMPGLAPELCKPAGASGGSWRRLTLDVTQDNVRGTWGEKEAIGELSTALLEEKARMALATMQDLKAQGASLKGIDPQFSPRGALGIYVYKGSASFRRVVIEPNVESSRIP
jgi:serine/threonine-protein kinase